MAEELERDQFDDLLKKSSEKLEATPSKNWNTLQSEELERLQQKDSRATGAEEQVDPKG